MGARKGRLKLTRSAPGLSLASWMAALSVHPCDAGPVLALQMPSPGFVSGWSPNSLTVWTFEAWAGAVITLAAITAASSRPATSAFIFLLHTNPSLLDCVVIALCPFLVALVKNNPACCLLLCEDFDAHLPFASS